MIAAVLALVAPQSASAASLVQVTNFGNNPSNLPRPRMQVWHGTNDTILRYPNFTEEIKQWTNVAGLSQTPSRTDNPQSGWTRYGGTGTTAQVEGISIQNGGHDLPRPGMAAMAIAFFGLNT